MCKAVESYKQIIKFDNTITKYNAMRKLTYIYQTNKTIHERNYKKAIKLYKTIITAH